MLLLRHLITEKLGYITRKQNWYLYSKPLLFGYGREWGVLTILYFALVLGVLYFFSVCCLVGFWFVFQIEKQLQSLYVATRLFLIV